MCLLNVINRVRIIIILSLWMLVFSSLLTDRDVSGSSSGEDEHKVNLAASNSYEQPRTVGWQEFYGIKFGEILVPEMVSIPAGSFNMGQPNKNLGGYEFSKDEQPVHRVEISTFELGRFEVTNAQYLAFSKATNREYAEWRQFFTKGKENYPVMNVTWADAQEYCGWLQAITGREYRLPTEAEWEYAARSQTNRNYRFIFGDGLSHRDALYDEKKRKDPSAVGKYKPNWFGLYDMLGNVWEWCSDYYDEHYYQNSPEKDPQGPSRGQYRVIRGGSWLSTEEQCRVANRAWFNPGFILDGRGFRIAVSAKQN
jgi:formylglycine-generating enzyme